MNPAAASTKPPFCAVGVDIGGTKIAAGTVTFPDGRVRTRRVIPSLPQRGADAVLADVEKLVFDLASEAGTGSCRVQAVGVGVCEIVSPAGALLSSGCLGLTGDQVSRRLSSIAPTTVEADVRAAARAEALLGAGHDAGIFLYVTIGTGIASCLVINGQPLVGARGATGTMASGPIPGWIEDDTEPLPASLEQHSSGPALVSRFQALQGDAQSGQDVVAAAAKGNEAAVYVVRSAAATLGASIGALVNVLDPALVVLGGGLGLSEGLYRETLIASARRHIWWPGHRELPIVSAKTGADAGWLGAAVAAWQARLT